MSDLTKKRVHWKEYNGEELVADEDVDVLTSAEAVTFSDGETMQYKYTQGQFVNPSTTGMLSNLSTTNKSTLVDAINEVQTAATSGASSIDTLTGRVTTAESDIDTLENRVTPISLGGTGATTVSDALTNLGAAAWNQTVNDVDLDTIKKDGIYELRYTTFDSMNVPSPIQTLSTFPAKLLLIVADINATFYQIAFSEWGCFIRRWNQGGIIGSWQQFGGSQSAPLPISSGGTGATTVRDAQTNLQIYSSLGSLNLSSGCTTHDIITALPDYSIFSFAVNNNTIITDIPSDWGQLTIIKSNYRKTILYNTSLTSGENGNNFWFGEHGNNTVTWYKIFTANPGCIIPIENGGTGATTTDEALKNLKTYTSVEQLGLTYPCTTVQIITAMPINSEVKIAINKKSDSITDLPIDYCILTIRYNNLNRYQILCTNMTAPGSEGIWFGNYVRGTSVTWEKIFTNSQTIPIENGGTGATDYLSAQSNLGLLKRYTDFSHLTLEDGYTLKDVFLAMADNTYIEYPITSSMNITVGPLNSGMLKIYRLTRNFGYAEFYGNVISENSMWVGSLHAERSFVWNKVWTSNKTIPIENGGTGASTASEAVSNLKTALVDLLYPIGSIHMSVNSENPSTYFGGTWVSWGSGQVPVGVDTSDSDFSTVEKTGGEKTHKLTINEMPSHYHRTDGDGGHYGWGGNPEGWAWAGDEGGFATNLYNVNTGISGGDKSHNNLQPYITCYMWKRTE